MPGPATTVALKNSLFELVSMCCGDLLAVAPAPTVVVAVVVYGVAFVVTHDDLRGRLSFFVRIIGGTLVKFAAAAVADLANVSRLSA